MTTEREALDRIAALCDEERWPNSPLAADVRAILAEVTPAPGCTLDRDKARDALIWMQQNGGLDMYGWDDCLARLAACVRPATIDRDALERLVIARYSRGNRWTTEKFADAILALVRPVAGVTLAPEEAARIVRWYTSLPIGVSADDVELAGRLKEVAP